MSLRTQKSSKDEETIQKENDEKLEKLFKELDYSIQNEQYRLSKVICNAILKIDPSNLKVVDYVDKIPEQVDSTKADIESFVKLGLILMAPGALIFLIFYRFLKNSENKNKDYFDNLDTEKQGNGENNNKSEAEKKFSSKQFKSHSFNSQNKNKFKFSTMNQFPQSGLLPLDVCQPTYYKQSRLHITPKNNSIYKCMKAVLKKLI